MNPAEELFNEIKRDGYKVVDRLVRQEKRAESTWLDYKVTCNLKNLEEQWDSTRSHFSKAVSGFGNSDGGLVIWGVNCPSDTDIPEAIVSVPDVKKLETKFNSELSETTRPAHALVKNLAVPEREGGTSGVVVTYVPVAPNRPLQAQRAKRADFYIRAGDSFGEAPYNLLAGMFGRPPFAEVEVKSTAKLRYSKSGFQEVAVARDGARMMTLDIFFEFLNIGSIVVREAYLSNHVKGFSSAHFFSLGAEEVISHRQWPIGPEEFQCGFLAEPGFGLTPMEKLLAGRLHLSFHRKDDGFDFPDVSIKMCYGAKSAIPTNRTLLIPGKRLDNSEAAMSLAEQTEITFTPELI